MTARDFCFWLQGYLELSQEDRPTLIESQVEMVRKQLALVFKHDIEASRPSFSWNGEPNVIPLNGATYRG